MARFNIIDALTGAVKYSGAPKYNGVYCKPSYLEFTEIASPVPVDWKVGDYVVYSRTGMTYRLYDIPQPKKQGRRTEYGGAFVYQNVQFYADTKWLDIEPFRDIVLDDNEIHFSTRESWSVWTNVASLLERMQAVMNASSSARFTFRLVDAVPGSDLHELLHDNYQDFQISGESVMGGLEKIYEQWGNIGWLHTVENGVNVITVGIPPVRVGGIGTDTDDEFIYGMGHALTSLRRTATNRDALRTRLYVYGSTRNMIPRYYNNLTPYIKDHESVDIQHLMIPLSEWGLTSGERDASKAYLENNVSEFGVRPDSVYFDGSELEEIYPSIEKATIGNLYDAMEAGAQYRPDLSKWGRDDRLDEVVSASGITDDGQRSSSGNKYVQVQYVSTLVHATSEYENFSQYLIENYSLGYSGKITIDFRGLTATVTDNGGSVETLDCTIVARVGGKGVPVNVTWTKSGNVYTLAIPSLSFEANAGDRLYVSLYVNFRHDRTNSPVAFSVLSRSAAIQYAYNHADTFAVRIPQIGFDIASRSNLGSEGIATIAMRDGMCGGRSFAVKSCTYVSSADAWDLTVYRGKDESLDILFPNTGFPISAGDHFVLLDIAMPDTYIGIAEQRLLAAGQALLEDVSRIKPFYEPEINSKYVYENGLALREGWYMPVRDTDITAGQSEYVLIDTLTINEGESNIPTYRVTLREQKRTSYTNTGTTGGGTSMTSLAGGSPSGTNSGGIVSVGLTMPEQFSVGGSPVAGTGTLTVSLNPLYAIPTAEQVASIAILASMLEVKNYASGKWALHVKSAALDSSGTMRTIDGIYSDGFVSAGGIGPGGGGGGEGGINTITIGSKSYSAQAGSTAIVIPTTGTDSVKVPLGITSLESRVTVLENRPQGGVTSWNSRTGDVSLTKQDVENVLTGNITSHTHSQYLTTSVASSTYAPIASLTAATGRITTLEGRFDSTGKLPWSGLSNVPSIVNTFGAQAGAITVRGGQTANGSVNLAMSGKQLQASIVGLQAGAFDASYVHTDNNFTTALKNALQTLESLFTKESDGNGGYRIKANYGLYTESFLSAGGIGPGGQGGGSIVTWSQAVTSETKIATITIDGVATNVYVPATGVTTFNGRSGAVSLSTADVTTALGYTPYNAASIGGATVAYAGQVTAKNTGKALSAINAVASSADLWNNRGNSWVFENYNNALAITVGGVSNDRVANIQVGHSITQYGGALGALYLNKLGGDVYIGSGLALHSGNYTAYCATAAQGAKADAAYGWGNHASAGYAAASALSAHIGNKSNPHSVTKAQVGLGNVDNTADANKSVARAHGLTSVQITTSFDLDTALSGGGVTGNYGGTSYWVNGPIGMGYGSVAQIQASEDRADKLALQIAWDINHGTSTPTNRLWFRTSNNGWGHDWKEIYHSGNSNKSGVAWACSTLTASGNAIVSGNVGIGTTSPTEKLELFGGALKIRSRGVSGTEYVTIATSDVSCHINGYNSDGWMNFYIQSNGVTKWTLNGRDGTFVATGNVTAGSDRRWKENISYSVGGIDIIKKLRPATWDWKEGHGKGKGAGLIAQDVMAVLPYAVQGSGKDGYTLNYNVFHAFEISALQQHENEIDRLRRKVAELEKRLNIN